jgi:hypothetical protein
MTISATYHVTLGGSSKVDDHLSVNRPLHVRDLLGRSSMSSTIR